MIYCIIWLIQLTFSDSPSVLSLVVAFMNLLILSLVCVTLSEYFLVSFISVITYDFFLSTVGHVFAYGLSRSGAITNMSLVLKEIQIHGETHSNVDYTVDLLNVRILIAL
jgi:hypothetical protein